MRKGILLIVIWLMSVDIVEGGWLDRLRQTLFGRHNDFYDLHMGKISQDEFDRREKARELAWKAIPLAISPLAMHSYMGTNIKNIDKVLKSSGVYEKSKDYEKSKKSKDKHGGIDFSY